MSDVFFSLVSAYWHCISGADRADCFLSYLHFLVGEEDNW